MLYEVEVQNLNKTFLDIFRDIQGINEQNTISTTDIKDIEFLLDNNNKITINYCGGSDNRKFTIIESKTNNCYIYNREEFYKTKIYDYANSKKEIDFGLCKEYIKISKNGFFDFSSSECDANNKTKENILKYLHSQNLELSEYSYFEIDDYIAVKCISCENEIEITLSRLLSSFFGSTNIICKECSKIKNIIPVSLIDKFSISDEDLDLSWRGIAYVNVKCPTCNKEKKIQARRFKENGFRISCECESKTSSFSENYFALLLNSLGLVFEKEKKFNWLCKKRYDFYLPNTNTIIELHGIQHYSENNNFSNVGGRDFNEEIENDELKQIEAINNGISKYIVINCSNASSNIIKFFNNILSNEDVISVFNIEKVENSKLTIEYLIKIYLENHGFDVNYDKMAKICSMFESGVIISEISKITNVDRKSVGEMLKKGASIGLCEYEPSKKTTLKSLFENIDVYDKKTGLIVCTINNENIDLGAIAKTLKISENTARRYIKKETKPSKYTFVFR